MSNAPNDIAFLLSALRFSAEKHTHQRRKSEQRIPYINHPIEVAEVLSREGRISDPWILAAALLHDTVEDTDTSLNELAQHFGEQVAHWVAELSDNTCLSKQQRKQQQILNAPTASIVAKQIKLADKICNIKDITYAPPVGWSLERKRAYLQWAHAVVAGLRGCNPRLEAYFDQILNQAQQQLG